MEKGVKDLSWNELLKWVFKVFISTGSLQFFAYLIATLKKIVKIFISDSDVTAVCKILIF